MAAKSHNFVIVRCAATANYDKVMTREGGPSADSTDGSDTADSSYSTDACVCKKNSGPNGSTRNGPNMHDSRSQPLQVELSTLGSKHSPALPRASAMEEPECATSVKGITWLSSKAGWQVYHNKKYLGYFNCHDGVDHSVTWKQAVQAKAEAMGITKKKLLQSVQSVSSEQSAPSVPSHPQQFRGVTTFREKYMAQNPATSAYIGLYDSKTEAAAAVADEVCLTMSGCTCEAHWNFPSESRMNFIWTSNKSERTSNGPHMNFT